MKEQAPHPARIPLWPLPLIAGLTVLGGAIGAAWLSMRLELTPTCNPLFDGCVSISRAGRHGLANIFFQGLVLPSAVLQAITWWLCGHWLASQQPFSPAPWFARLGVLAGIFLGVYASFLGTDGDVYRWLRQYGTIFYFGFTYLCMLMLLGRLRRMQDAPRAFAPALQALCIGLLLLGLSNTLLAQLFDDPIKDRIENVTEWWLGLGFVMVFVLIAETWRRLRVAMYLHHAR
jgi:hypothetical protein